MPRSASVTQVRAMHRSNQGPAPVRDGSQPAVSGTCTLSLLSPQSGSDINRYGPAGAFRADIVAKVRNCAVIIFPP